MQTTNAQHNLNIASTEDTFCVVCYETCKTKLSCCKQEICNGCSEEIAKLHENPTCPTCRAKFKSFTLSELSQMDTTVQLTYLKENKYITNIYGKITLKPKTVKITKKNGITKYIKYRNIISYGLKENPKTIYSFKVNLDWQNWMNKSLTLKRINKEPKSYIYTEFNRIYSIELDKQKIILKNELIEILTNYQKNKILFNENNEAYINGRYEDIAEYLRLRKTITLKIYKCINEYWKWFDNACNKKLFGKIIETLDIEYNNLISEIEQNY
tara:strand:- start:115 stop:924 length:810 start_codon:yes stop_codon:yes gene_type:complete